MIQKLLIITASACLLASCRKTSEEEMMILRDCTGTYLQKQNVYYRVCNSESTNSFSDSTRVKVRFRIISSCTSNDVECFMLRAYEKDVHVNDISAY